MKKDIENEGWETNRYKKLRITRKNKFWCGCCDMELVAPGEKCTIIRHRHRKTAIGGEKRKLKKY